MEVEEEEEEEEVGREEEECHIWWPGRSCVTIWNEYGSTEEPEEVEEPTDQPGSQREAAADRGMVVPVGHTRGATCRRSHPVTCHRFIYFYGGGRATGGGRWVVGGWLAPNGVELHQTPFFMSGWRLGWSKGVAEGDGG